MMIPGILDPIQTLRLLHSTAKMKTSDNQAERSANCFVLPGVQEWIEKGVDIGEKGADVERLAQRVYIIPGIHQNVVDLKGTEADEENERYECEWFHLIPLASIRHADAWLHDDHCRLGHSESLSNHQRDSAVAICEYDAGEAEIAEKYERAVPFLGL